MGSRKPPFYKRSISLILLVAIALPALSKAEKHRFELIYADVPGSAEIRARKLDAAIGILEERAQKADKHYVSNELATLCGLYIVKGQLSAASITCQNAVETDQSKAAYNNRGVFRTQLGNTSGALEDFAEARSLPNKNHRYIEELMSGDPNVVTSNNYLAAEEYELSLRDDRGTTMASQSFGASIEDLGSN